MAVMRVLAVARSTWKPMVLTSGMLVEFEVIEVWVALGGKILCSLTGSCLALVVVWYWSKLGNVLWDKSGKSVSLYGSSDDQGIGMWSMWMPENGLRRWCFAAWILILRPILRPMLRHIGSDDIGIVLSNALRSCGGTRGTLHSVTRPQPLPDKYLFEPRRCNPTRVVSHWPQWPQDAFRVRWRAGRVEPGVTLCQKVHGVTEMQQT